jgi:hypothetical protein
MILATHAIVGAALGRLIPYPWGAFLVGFASHFAIDAIPHWQYRLASMVHRDGPMENDMVIHPAPFFTLKWCLVNRKFIGDLARTGLDFAAGMVLSILLFQGTNNLANISIPLIAGAVGGVLPDALQFAYFKIRREPLTTLQKIHLWAHAKRDFTMFPYGIASQALVIASAVVISKLILK